MRKINLITACLLFISALQVRANIEQKAPVVGTAEQCKKENPTTTHILELFFNHQQYATLSQFRIGEYTKVDLLLHDCNKNSPFIAISTLVLINNVDALALKQVETPLLSILRNHIEKNVQGTYFSVPCDSYTTCSVTPQGYMCNTYVKKETYEIMKRELIQKPWWLFWR